MESTAIKIDSSFNNNSLDQLIEDCLDNKPFTRDTIPILTAEEFFNNVSDKDSIRHINGFMSYYNALSEDEQTCFKALFKFMKAGFFIHVVHQEVVLEDQVETEVDPEDKIKILDNMMERLIKRNESRKVIQPIIFAIGYELNPNHYGSKYLACQIPGSRSIYDLIFEYNNKYIDCYFSLEDLLVEAMKRESLNE